MENKPEKTPEKRGVLFRVMIGSMVIMFLCTSLELFLTGNLNYFVTATFLFCLAAVIPTIPSIGKSRLLSRLIVIVGLVVLVYGFFDVFERLV